MPHVLLTQKDPSFAAAALDVLPSAEVHQLDSWYPDNSDESTWCFIDCLLDDISGLELCRRLRARRTPRPLHITIILDEADPTARARAIAAGADDYLPGPLTPESLAERLRIYACDAPPPTTLQSSQGLTVNVAASQVRWRGQLVPMPPNELRLLDLFMKNPDRLLSRDQVIALLGKQDEVEDDRTVDVWVGRLRRRLEAAGVRGLFRTVRSMGYVFDTP